MSMTQHWHPRWSIRMALEEEGLKQKDLARRLGWAESRVSKLLGGEQTMTVDDLVQMARALDREVELLFKPPPHPEVVSSPTAPLRRRQTVDYGTTVQGLHDDILVNNDPGFGFRDEEAA